LAGIVRLVWIVTMLPDNPATLRAYAAIFDRMTPSTATLAAVRALRFMAEEVERRSAMPSADHQANAFNGAAACV
jgi:hypothetical protein